MSDDPVEIINSAVREFEAGRRDSLAAAAAIPPLDPAGPMCFPAPVTLRDYFATHAPAIPADFEPLERIENYIDDGGPQRDPRFRPASKTITESGADHSVRWRWHYADAMLAAREKPP